MRTVVLLLLCVLSAGAASSLGGSIVLTPTTIVLGPADAAASVAVRNDTGAPVHFRVRPLKWRNTGSGDMVVDSTDELMVFPEDVSLAPGETRRIRLGSRRPRDPRQDAEQAYRLLLESVPEATSNGESGPSIKTRLQFSLPVFLQPKARTVRVDMQPPDIVEGQVRLVLSNSGQLHVTPTAVEVSGLDRDGQIVWTRQLRAWYLLPGEIRPYAATLSVDECRRTAMVVAETAFAEDARLTLREKRQVSSSGVCAGR